MNALIISALASLAEAIGAVLTQTGHNSVRVDFAEGGHVTVSALPNGAVVFENHAGSLAKASKTVALFAAIVEHSIKFDMDDEA